MTWIFDLPFLLSGAAIGLAISAPVGPIGVLCIQRTLAKGRIAGLVTGLGAATADAGYAAIAALGLAFISEILIAQQPLVSLIGGGFLIFLGIKTFVSKPAEETAPNGKRGLLGAFASALVLTLTNPISIIYFAAIFSALGVAATGGKFSAGAQLVLGVFLGSALWWFLLSGGVSLLRDRVSPSGMRWVNRGSGAIITIFGASALIFSIAA